LEVVVLSVVVPRKRHDNAKNPYQHSKLQGAPMFEGLFQPMHLLLIFGIALLVLGPKKLPELGKGLGDSIRGFKSAMSEKEDSSNQQDANPKT